MKPSMQKQASHLWVSGLLLVMLVFFLSQVEPATRRAFDALHSPDGCALETHSALTP